MTRRKTPVTEDPLSASRGDPVEVVVDESAVIETNAPPIDLPLPDPSEATPAPTPPPARPPARGLGIFGPVLGGILAALAGFGVSETNLLGFRPADQTAALAALTDRQTSLDAELAELVDRIAAVESMPLPELPDLSRLDDLDQRLQVVEAVPSSGGGDTQDLAARLAGLEEAVANLPTIPGNPAEIDAALARLAELEAAAEAQSAAAAEAAMAAERARALEALAEAVAAGSGFEVELAAVTDPGLQAALAPHVGGVTPLTQLQAEFPDAARAALQLARQTDGDDGWGSRLSDFLADQTGARSVTPREGDDPDAILSRAEFALSEGRLADALAELATLSPDIRAPLEDWITKASARVAVDAALMEAM